MVQKSMVFIYVSYLGTVVAYDNDRFRQRLEKAYFDAGYTYNLFLCFLAGVHCTIISLRTLKHLLQRMTLHRRGASTLSRPQDSCQVYEGSFCFSFKFFVQCILHKVPLITILLSLQEELSQPGSLLIGISSYAPQTTSIV